MSHKLSLLNKKKHFHREHSDVSTATITSTFHHDRYRKGPLLGEGQFGRVKEAYLQCDSISPNNRPYKLAVKKLQKGMTFRKNIIYTRLRPEILQL